MEELVRTARIERRLVLLAFFALSSERERRRLQLPRPRRLLHTKRRATCNRRGRTLQAEAEGHTVSSVLSGRSSSTNTRTLELSTASSGAHAAATSATRSTTCADIGGSECLIELQ